jgi:hypothetical protein
MRARLTDISVQVRQIRDKAIMVADGTMDGKKERWFALPLSMIEVEPEEYEVGDTVTVTLPESLAMEKELI